MQDKPIRRAKPMPLPPVAQSAKEKTVPLRINGKDYFHEGDADMPLLWFLRDVLRLTGTFDQLLNYSTVGDWLGIAAVIATLFWYHRRQGGEPVSFLVPLYPVLPLLFLIVVAWIVAVTCWRNPHDALWGVLITVAGLPVYWFWRWLGSRSRA